MQRTLLATAIALSSSYVFTGYVFAANAVLDDMMVEEIQIIGNKADQLRIPGSSHRVDSEELAKFGYSDINQMLAQVPGLYMQAEEGYGLRPNIGIRGAATGRSAKIAVMEDGILAAPAPYGNPEAYWSPTAARAQAVEVLTGPSILAYGPMTVGGAVNYVTTAIPDETTGSVSAMLGEHGEWRLMGNAGTTIGNTGVLVEALNQGADGFHNIDRSNADSGFDKQDYMIKLTHDFELFGKKQDISLKLSSSDEASQSSYVGLTDADMAANADRRYGFTALDEMNNDAKQMVVRYALQLTDNWAVNAVAYDSEVNRDWFKVDKVAGNSVGGIITDINTMGGTYADGQGWLDGTVDAAIDIKHNNRMYDSHGVQLNLDGEFEAMGVTHDLRVSVREHRDAMNRFQPVELYQQVNGELVFDTIKDPSGSNNRYERANAFSALISDRITAGALEVSALLRYEDVTTSRHQWSDTDRVVDPSYRSNDTEEWLPGVGASYDLGSDNALIAGVHRGFAPAGAGAKQGTGAELSTNYEFGYRGLHAGYELQVIGFVSDYENTVINCSVANPCGAVTSGTESLGESMVKGLELELANEFNLGSWSVPMSASYTYTDAQVTSTSDDGASLDGDDLPYIPDNQFAMQVGAVSGKVAAYVNTRYQSGACVDVKCSRADGRDDQFFKTDSYWITDMAVSYNLANDLVLQGRVENLFDERAVVSRSPYGARVNKPATISVGARYSF